MDDADNVEEDDGDDEDEEFEIDEDEMEEEKHFSSNRSQGESCEPAGAATAAAERGEFNTLFNPLSFSLI